MLLCDKHSELCLCSQLQGFTEKVLQGCTSFMVSIHVLCKLFRSHRALKIQKCSSAIDQWAEKQLSVVSQVCLFISFQILGNMGRKISNNRWTLKRAMLKSLWFWHLRLINLNHFWFFALDSPAPHHRHRESFFLQQHTVAQTLLSQSQVLQLLEPVKSSKQQLTLEDISAIICITRLVSSGYAKNWNLLFP